MPDKSPDDSTPPAAAEGSSEEVTTTPPEGEEGTTEDESPSGKTVEEVEATWKTRVSNKDKAHAAAEQVLRDQIVSLTERAERAEKSLREGNQTGSAEADQWKAQYEAEKTAREQDAARYTTEVRSAKYPYAAEALDAMGLVSMDEAKLAALNVRLSDEGEPAPTGHVDPSSARRGSPEPPKPLGERSVAELTAELERQGPAFADRLKEASSG